MDDFLRDVALGDEGSDHETHVVVHPGRPQEVLAFSAVYPTSQFYEGPDAEIDPEPTFWIDYLGVCVDLQGQGIGTTLLVTLLHRALLIADKQIRVGRVPIGDVGLYAATERSKRWFLKFGFEEQTAGGRHLILPIATLRQLPIPPGF